VQIDGLLKEIKTRSFYEKPSVKEKRKRAEARKKRAKALKSRKFR
jgi:small subunit ribosomal protein S21